MEQFIKDTIVVIISVCIAYYFGYRRGRDSFIENGFKKPN